MNCITLRSFLDGKDLFGEVNKLQKFPFIGESSTEINTMLLVSYGDRTLFKAFDNMDITIISNLIVKLYADKWVEIITALNDNLNLMADSTDTRKETTVNSGNKTDVTDTVNKVSAYNKDDLINDTGVNTNLNETTSGNMVKTYEGGKNSLNYLFNNLSLLDKTNIMNLVLKDVSNYLTLSVY